MSVTNFQDQRCQNMLNRNTSAASEHIHEFCTHACQRERLTRKQKCLTVKVDSPSSIISRIMLLYGLDWIRHPLYHVNHINLQSAFSMFSHAFLNELLNYIQGIRILLFFSPSFHQENIIDWDNISPRWNKKIHKGRAKVLAQDPWLTALLTMGTTVEKECKNRDCATSKICTPDHRKCFEVVK